MTLKKLLSNALTVAILIYGAVISYYVTHYIDFYPINGDFQAFNPLRRLQAGFTIAKDFNVYLGLGVTYFSYVFYRTLSIFGLQDLQTSYLTFSLLGLCSFVFTAALICRLLNYSRYYTLLAITLTFENLYFFPLTQSDNSLLIIRTLAASMLSLLFVKYYEALLHLRTIALIGIASGVAMIWSPDYGFPCSIAVLIGITLAYAKHNQIKRLCFALPVWICLAGLSYYLVGSYLTNYNFDAYLVYFRALGQNQLWYYLSGWMEDNKIYSLLDIPYPTILLSSSIITLLIIISYLFPNKTFGTSLTAKCMANTMPSEPKHKLALIVLIIAVIGGGYLPQIGGHISPHYVLPLTYILTIILIKFLASIWNLCLEPIVNSKPFKTTALVLFWTYACYALGARTYFLINRNYNSEKYHYDSKLKFNIRNDYAVPLKQAEALKANAATNNDSPLLFSTYSSIMEYYLGVFNPSRSDYIIHSLGDQEESLYLAAFKKAKPQFVSVVNESGIDWASWNQRINWKFYKHLYEHYEPYAINWYSIIYRPRTSDFQPIKKEIPFLIKRLSANKTLVELDVSNMTKEFGHIYGYAEIDYAIEREWDPTPIIGKRTYTQVYELSDTQFINAQKHKVPLKYIGIKYGLHPKAKEIFFEAHPKDSRIYLTFTGFPENGATLKLKSFKPQLLLSQTGELKKIPKDLFSRY